MWRNKVALRVGFYYGHAGLYRLLAIHPGHGDGTACLRWLIKLAARYNVAIVGHASNNFAGKTDKPSVMILRRWYRQHGAVFDRHGGFTIWPERR